METISALAHSFIPGQCKEAPRTVLSGDIMQKLAGGATRSVQRWFKKDKSVILIKMQLKLSISSHKAEPLTLLLPV